MPSGASWHNSQRLSGPWLLPSTPASPPSLPSCFRITRFPPHFPLVRSLNTSGAAPRQSGAVSGWGHCRGRPGQVRSLLLKSVYPNSDVNDNERKEDTGAFPFPFPVKSATRKMQEGDATESDRGGTECPSTRWSSKAATRALSKRLATPPLSKAWSIGGACAHAAAPSKMPTPTPCHDSSSAFCPFGRAQCHLCRKLFPSCLVLPESPAAGQHAYPVPRLPSSRRAGPRSRPCPPGDPGKGGRTREGLRGAAGV